MVRPGSSGTGHSSYNCSGVDMSGSVPAAVGHVATTASYSIAVSWFHAACFFGYRDCSSPAHVAARSSCYYYPSDSSYRAQWASESGIVGCTVCLIYQAGILVVCFTRDRAGLALHSYSHGLHSYSVHVSASDGHPCLQEFGCYF